jgi:hypothetical protein
LVACSMVIIASPFSMFFRCAMRHNVRSCEFVRLHIQICALLNYQNSCKLLLQGMLSIKERRNLSIIFRVQSWSSRNRHGQIYLYTAGRLPRWTRLPVWSRK